jgi:hypothetical protein
MQLASFVVLVKVRFITLLYRILRRVLYGFVMDCFL